MCQMHIHYKSLLTGVYDHADARCKKYCKDFTVALKFPMYSLRTKCPTVYSRGKKMLLKMGIVFYRCFCRVLIPNFLFGYACFMCSL